MLRMTLLVVALVLGLARGAEAQSVANELREFDLLGTWAIDCAKPAGHEGRNTHTIYAAAPSGAVTIAYDNGPSPAQTVNTILSASRQGEDRISYLQENQRTKAQIEIVLVKSGNTIKVWSSRRTTGEVLVRDGKFMVGGESPRQARCR